MSRPATPPDGDEWCTVAEAARRLGVTPTAIRNRIKRRTLEVKPNGNIGHLVRVPPPTPVSLTVSDTVPVTGIGTVSGTVSAAAAEALDRMADALVAELRDRVSELQGRVAASEAERVTIQQDAARERALAAQERERLQAAVAEAGQHLARLHEAREADVERHRHEMDDLRGQLEALRHRSWWRRIWAA